MSVINIDKESFEKLVSQDTGTVIVDFWAAWCGPCIQFGPIFERVSEKHPDVVFAKVNTDEHQELSQLAGIMSIPTLMIFRDGIGLFNQAGALPEPAFEDLIAQVKALDMVKVKQDVAAMQAERDLEKGDVPAS